MDGKLLEELQKLLKADGYLVLVTRLNGDTLQHTNFMKSFRNGDISPSIDEHFKLLEPKISK